MELFFQNLIGGTDSRRWASNLKQIRTKSISEDVVFTVTGGLKKPQNHLMLGIALKSLTGSRKVAEIMNRLGHCIGCNTKEEIEREALLKSTKKNLLTPSSMKLDPQYGTGVVWDNFDCFIETVSGNDTLHDTVGIAYQTVITDGSNETEHNNKKILRQPIHPYISLKILQTKSGKEHMKQPFLIFSHTEKKTKDR